VDHPIVQGDDWEQLKKGVGQYIGGQYIGGQHGGSAVPGQPGNVVLSAHNDIYGEIFRYLDRLSPGSEVIISTERESYTYVVREIRVVEPTDVWVMLPTETAQATLISCYPYRIDTRRIVVFTDLVIEEG
jgi:sortase A